MDPIKTQAWRRLRTACYNRDRALNAPCAICGQPIDYGLAPSSGPWAYEPDHRLPRTTHPELALVAENVQPAHKRCNRSKGGRASVNAVGTPSREW